MQTVLLGPAELSLVLALARKQASRSGLIEQNP